MLRDGARAARPVRERRAARDRAAAAPSPRAATVPPPARATCTRPASSSAAASSSGTSDHADAVEVGPSAHVPGERAELQAARAARAGHERPGARARGARSRRRPPRPGARAAPARAATWRSTTRAAPSARRGRAGPRWCPRGTPVRPRARPPSGRRPATGCAGSGAASARRPPRSPGCRRGSAAGARVSVHSRPSAALAQRARERGLDGPVARHAHERLVRERRRPCARAPPSRRRGRATAGTDGAPIVISPP